MKDLLALPPDLPPPLDDGACDHLAGTRLPAIALPGVSGRPTDLGVLPGRTVVYFYPMNGRPDAPPMVGWNAIAGARGCTPQACALRDNYQTLLQLGVQLFGVSAQPLAEQREAHARLHLPFELLNDSTFALAKALQLPSFEYQGQRYIKRLTIVVETGRINKVFYPVFPPDAHAVELVTWLQAQRS